MRGLHALSTLYPFKKPVVYLGPKCAIASDCKYLHPGTSDTQQNFPLTDLSPLCASKLPNRERVKLRLKLLSFRHAECGHLLYFNNMKPVHGQSWVLNSVLPQMSLGKERREGGILQRKEFGLTYLFL